MGKCGSKNRRNSEVDRLGKDYDYMGGAGTSGFGMDYNRMGYGGGGYGGYGLESSCPEGVNQNTALLATAAAIAVGAGVIFRAVTLQQGRRRRRKRELVGDTGSVQNRLMDLIVLGMENFQERVNDEESMQDDFKGDEGWISKLFREFHTYKTGLQYEFEEHFIDSLAVNPEPPLLDLTWGLDDKISTAGIGGDPNEEDSTVIDNGKCKVKVWRCMSTVMEEGVKYIEEPAGIWG